MRETQIQPDDTAGLLFGRLSEMGADLLGETLACLRDGSAPRTPQDDALATFAPPIQKSMAHLDFSIAPEDFCNLVRGLHPSPGARVQFGQTSLKIHRAAPVPDLCGEPGHILHPKRLIVACGQGAVELLIVGPAGKKSMTGAAWRNGLRGEQDLRFS